MEVVSHGVPHRRVLVGMCERCRCVVKCEHAEATRHRFLLFWSRWDVVCPTPKCGATIGLSEQWRPTRLPIAPPKGGSGTAPPPPPAYPPPYSKR